MFWSAIVLAQPTYHLVHTPGSQTGADSISNGLGRIDVAHTNIALLCVKPVHGKQLSWSWMV